MISGYTTPGEVALAETIREYYVLLETQLEGIKRGLQTYQEGVESRGQEILSLEGRFSANNRDEERREEELNSRVSRLEERNGELKGEVDRIKEILAQCQKAVNKFEVLSTKKREHRESGIQRVARQLEKLSADLEEDKEHGEITEAISNRVVIDSFEIQRGATYLNSVLERIRLSVVHRRELIRMAIDDCNTKKGMADSAFSQARGQRNQIEAAKKQELYSPCPGGIDFIIRYNAPYVHHSNCTWF